MTFWKDILENAGSDYDHGARRQLKDLQVQVAGAVDGRTVAQLAERLSQAERQIDQLVLGCAALAKLLEMKGVVPDEALTTMMQQLDLLDGYEDNAMGGHISESAPRCEGCNHFINPKRTECIYCSRSLTASAPQGGAYRGGPTAAAVPRVTCTACAKSTPQPDTVFNGNGELVCRSCS
ncbi:MAG: hypothetical protein ACI9KE_004290 [Polyangiales bacterium]|jgi:hypothetical protein